MGFGHILDVLVVGVKELGVGLDETPAGEDEDEAEECWEVHVGGRGGSC